MRRPERIPIVLKHIDLVDFIRSSGAFGIDEVISVTNVDKESIEKFWLENTDLRLTQVLVNLGIIPNLPGFWYYKEETDYLVEEGILTFEDVHFWGRNFTKDMVKLPQTEYVLLSDLTIDHIKNIIKIKGINPVYLKYFEQRIKEDGRDATENLLKDIKP